MSLVIAVGNSKFVLFCGEQRKNYKSGETEENFKKVIRLSDTCIMGITGTTNDLWPITNHLLINENQVRDGIQKQTYKEIDDELHLAFDEITKCIEDDPDPDEFNFFITIGGFDAGKMRIDAYAHSGGKSLQEHFIMEKEDELKYITMSNDEKHEMNFIKYVNSMSEKTILNFKNAFKDTVEKGMKFDKTINNNYTFEVIRRKDVE
ncbi:hypothetical protein [Eubacterium callanderi]|uniref:hypothetical protein n=1 Tax=Eubacterium callanderi TaxID=53442 RepID=UPI001C11D84C|nr:hypothetical protein [Eubacterium callanderi]MBU5306046.1 hypothetical protein [Eubacterium callanderi]